MQSRHGIPDRHQHTARRLGGIVINRQAVLEANFIILDQAAISCYPNGPEGPTGLNSKLCQGLKHQGKSIAGLRQSQPAASMNIMMHHEYAWCIIKESWSIMKTHAAPWFFMMHHEYSWCIMNTFKGVHDAQVLCLPSKYSFLELIPGLPGSRQSCPSTPPRDLPSTHAAGQDDVSSKQTPSN